jgi:hypothetical protein
MVDIIRRGDAEQTVRLTEPFFKKKLAQKPRVNYQFIKREEIGTLSE